jgi:hypothetical protein
MHTSLERGEVALQQNRALFFIFGLEKNLEPCYFKNNVKIFTKFSIFYFLSQK